MLDLREETDVDLSKLGDTGIVFKIKN